jgi:hypothetical protein
MNRIPNTFYRPYPRTFAPATVELFRELCREKGVETPFNITFAYNYRRIPIRRVEELTTSGKLQDLAF